MFAAIRSLQFVFAMCGIALVAGDAYDVAQNSITILGPADNSHTRNRRPIFSATIADTVSGIASYSLIVDGKPTVPAGKPVTTYSGNKLTRVTFQSTLSPDHVLSEGWHWAELTVRDNAGNATQLGGKRVGKYEARTLPERTTWIGNWDFDIDLTPPEAIMQSDGWNGFFRKPDADFALLVVDSMSGLDPVTTAASVMIDGRPATANFTGVSFSIHGKDLSEGWHTLHFVAKDKAGDWQNPNDDCNCQDYFYHFLVHTETLYIQIYPTYGKTPLTWTAKAYRAGQEVTGQCTFKWTSSLPITSDGASCTIPVTSPAGLATVYVSATFVDEYKQTFYSEWRGEKINIGKPATKEKPSDKEF